MSSLFAGAALALTRTLGARHPSCHHLASLLGLRHWYACIHLDLPLFPFFDKQRKTNPPTSTTRERQRVRSSLLRAHGLLPAAAANFCLVSPSSTVNMKLLIATALAGSACAFAPAQQGARVASALNAEKSKALPFLNRPALVSSKVNVATAASVAALIGWTARILSYVLSNSHTFVSLYLIFGRTM